MDRCSGRMADVSDEDPPFDVASFLAEALRPAQVAAVSDSGLPVLGSLWFLYEDGRFWFSSSVETPLLRALSHGSEIAVIVDEFSPPERIRQVRVRGPGRVEPHDPQSVERIYRRYLGANLNSWPPLFRHRLTDRRFALWSVAPSSGLIAAFPDFDAREARWSAPTTGPMP